MPLRFGLIGCGGMGRELAQVLRERVDEAVVSAAFDPYAPNLTAAVEALGATPAGSVEDLLARDDVDAVIIATPNHLHCEQTVAAAAAGKHVFCEKPMALSVADCDRMIAACERARVRLMVGHSMRLGPLARKLREVVSSGEIGEPLFGMATYLFSGFRPREFGTWHLDRKYVGGLFYHMAVHHIDLFHAVFGPTRRVQYAGGRYGKQVHDFDDVGTLLLEFESGATAVISSSSICPFDWRHLHIICSSGGAWWDSPWTWLGYGPDGDHVTKVTRQEVPGPGELELELRSFVRWVLYGETPVLTGAEGRAAVAVAEAADRAKESGAPAYVDRS